jgi:hypothetical protein
MRNTGLDILILSIVLIVVYARPCWMVSFFNTLVGRLILLGAITALAIKDTLWALFGILLLVGFRDGLIHEGMTNMDKNAVEAGDHSDAESDNEGDDHDKTAEKADKAQEKKELKEAKKEAKGKVMSNKAWKKQYCKNNKVMLDGAEVNIEEMEKKFPDLEFLNGKCNPCLSNCEFKITTAGARVDAEETMRGKASNTVA